MFDRALARSPDAPALVDGELRLSYSETDRLIRRCARRIAGLGVRPGDRVALLLGNRADFPILMLAIARLGAISVPMNVRQKRAETANALNDSGAILLFHEAELDGEIPVADDVPQLTQMLAVSDDCRAWDGVVEDGEAPVYPEIEEEDPFCILYTSGTTGRPKGAVLTHFSTVTSCIGAEQHLMLRDGETTVLSVPASHVTGVVLILLLMVRVAGTVVMQRIFKARPFLELAAAERMTFAIMVPAMYNLCLMEADYDRFDLSSWRVGAYGGAPMPEPVLAALAERNPGLALSNVYGATETSSPAVIMPADLGRARSAQLGRPLSCCDLVIMDDAGREVPRGEQGEIWIGGAMVIPHYWNNPNATRDSFTAGYWKSGDIGSLDEDGFLQLFDRKKDMINRGGYKIYSVEVENVLMAHPAVAEAGVVGRTCPVLGERVEAFVTLKSACDEDGLRSHCAGQLSDYKVPETVRIVEGNLPRNANGKLLKQVLRKWLEAAPSGAA